MATLKSGMYLESAIPTICSTDHHSTKIFPRGISKASLMPGYVDSCIVCTMWKEACLLLICSVLYQWMFKGNTQFNQDVSRWELTKLSDATEMFLTSTSFNQNLCRWAEFLPATAIVDNMFTDTSCPSFGTPVLATVGEGTMKTSSFCNVCT